MSTIIYPSPIVGPIHSRRLGISLGVNVNPSDGKICTFDCIYCEVGYNSNRHTKSPRPTRQHIASALEAKLKEMKADESALDVITFSGNGEPTATSWASSRTPYGCATITILTPRFRC